MLADPGYGLFIIIATCIVEGSKNVQYYEIIHTILKVYLSIKNFLKG